MLDDERWDAHRAAHAELAGALATYKADANEWRGSLSDGRATFITRTEYEAEHRALSSGLGARIDSTAAGAAARLDAIDARLDGIDRALDVASVRDKTTRDLFNIGRNLILLVLGVVGGLITIAVYLGK